MSGGAGKHGANKISALVQVPPHPFVSVGPEANNVHIVTLERGQPDGKWGIKVSFTQKGVRVEQIHPDSGAAKDWNSNCVSGHDYLRIGDVITRINDATVDEWSTSAEERCSLLMKELADAQTVRMEIKHEHV